MELRINDIAQEVMDHLERYYRGVDSALAQASDRAEHINDVDGPPSARGISSSLTSDTRVYLFRDGELLQLTWTTRSQPRARKPAIADTVTSART
jgi:hypothetical protein